MKYVYEKIKYFLLHPTVHSLVVALTAMYLLFGVLNAGFIMVNVLAQIIDFFFHHSSTHGNIIHMWLGGIVFG